MNRWLAWGAALLGAVGCAHAPAHSVSSANGPKNLNRLVIHSQSLDVDAVVTPRSIVGPSISVERFDSALRGEAYGRPVNLEVDPAHQQIAGIIGRSPVKLQVVNENGEIRTRGLLAGRMMDFTASPRAINGTIGPCSYQLVWTGGAYEGSRACHQLPEAVEIQIPEVMSRWTPTDLMASLGIFLTVRG